MNLLSTALSPIATMRIQLCNSQGKSCVGQHCFSNRISTEILDKYLGETSTALEKIHTAPRA